MVLTFGIPRFEIESIYFDVLSNRTVAKLLARVAEENWMACAEGKSGNVPRSVLVVTKISLLPTSLLPARFEHWVRQRVRGKGAFMLARVHLVSVMRY